MVREFTDEQNIFYCNQKDAKCYPDHYSAGLCSQVASSHLAHHLCPAPCNQVAKFQQHSTVQYRRKRRPSARQGAVTVTTEDAIDNVRISQFWMLLSLIQQLNLIHYFRAVMDNESACHATETGCSQNRNPFSFSATTFQKILKDKLKLYPYNYLVLPLFREFLI